MPAKSSEAEGGGRTIAGIGDVQPGGQIEAITFLGSGLLARARVHGVASRTREVRGWLADGERPRRLGGSPDRPRAGTARTKLGRCWSSLGLRRGAAPSRHAGLGEQPAAQLRLRPRSKMRQFPWIASPATTSPSSTRQPAPRCSNMWPPSWARDMGAQSRSQRPLRVLRDAVRPKLQSATIEPAAEYAADVDGLWRVSHSSFYIKGWLFDRGSTVNHLRLIAPDGGPIDILGRVFQHPRPDVASFFKEAPRERLGFIAYVDAQRDVLSSGWILEMGTAKREPHRGRGARCRR